MKVTTRDGTALAVHEMGSGPALLCVPGGPGRAAAYLEDLGGLSATRSLRLVDNRGSGESELPADRSSLAFPRLADDVEDVRLALGLDRADVLGHSAGTAVALLHAARHPDVVRRLVLVTPSGRVFGWQPDDLEAIRARRSSEPWYTEVAEAAEFYPSANPRMRAELDRVMRPLWYGSWDDRTRAHAASADEQVSLRAAAGYVPAAGEYDAEAAVASLRGVRAEVLVVVGELDAMTGVSVAARFADALPTCETAVVAGAGHFPWVDQPERFSDVVEGFLAR